MEVVDIEVEAGGTLLLSSLKAIWPNATGLTFVSENGRKRSVRVFSSKLFPPQGKWGDRTYEVVIPEQSPCGNVNESTPVIGTTTTTVSGSATVTGTKQKTLVVEGRALKLGTELTVSLCFVCFICVCATVFLLKSLHFIRYQTSFKL